MVRPTQQASTKRKRKSNDLIWARDGDHKNAQEHPAYLLENCNEEGAPSNDNEKVWVEWSSNGTIACIPKSRISNTGLSSRRRRTNNEDTKQSSDNNNEQLTTNNTTKQKNKSSKEDTMPDYILVEGCGIPEVNGTYDLGTPLNGLYYIKRGEWKGEVKNFLMYRVDCYWYIGLSFVARFCFYRAKNNTKRPLPVNGWTVMAKGVDPAPTLTLKYFSNNDNITSLVSDSIKVKTEDSTKVKEEMNGGGTDDDEDEKIAAVLTPVVSSQLTKSAYDEDTDDDVAPDAVQSSQVKVKEEEGEDTNDDDDDAPDPVQSIQIKQEHDEESTDNEGMAPDPVLSSRVKTEEEETDDEGAHAPAESTRALQKRWVCDVCKVKWFLDFSEAVKHEKTCNGRPPLSNSSDSDASKDDEDRKIAAPSRSDAYEEKDENDESIWDDSESEAESFASCESKSITKWDSSVDEYKETAKVYLWCEGQYSYKKYALVLLPYNWYLFWKKLKRCKSFGDIRTLCGKDHYYNFEDRYAMRHEYDSDYEDYDTCMETLFDSKKICMDDFDLSEHSDYYGDCTAVGMFPPVLEQVMWQGATREKRHRWMLKYGEVHDPWGGDGNQWLKFKSEDKDKIFKKIEELGCTVRHLPKLGEKFTSIYEM